MAKHEHMSHLTAAATPRELVARARYGGPGFWIAVLVLAIVAAAGLAALAAKLAGGPEPRAKWGYVAATVAFLMSAAQAAPILAFATRFGKGLWAVGLSRAAELLAVAGLVTVPLFIILLFQLPEWRGRHSIWFDWPGAPQLWDSVAMVLLGLTGLSLLYLSSLPDFAAARDAGSGGWARRLALGWTGTVRQWQVLQPGLVVLGAFYLMVFVFTHLLLVSDLAISLVPGWKSAIIPAYHAVTAFQASIAATLLLLAALRRFGGLKPYIGLDPFWSAAKILLALSLLFFYFTWAELLTYWYGRLPEEGQLLSLLMFGSYFWPFLLAVGLNFLLPLLLLIWNRIRVSVAGPVFVAALIVSGNFIDRVRIYVASWSTAGPPGQHLEHLPPFQPPDLLDGLVMLGLPAAVGMLYLLALRLVPAISVWEYGIGTQLRLERPLLRTRLLVVAKPR